MFKTINAKIHNEQNTKILNKEKTDMYPFISVLAFLSESNAIPSCFCLIINLFFQNSRPWEYIVNVCVPVVAMLIHSFSQTHTEH